MKLAKFLVVLVQHHKLSIALMLLMTCLSSVSQVLAPFAFGEVIEIIANLDRREEVYITVTAFALVTLLALLAEQILNYIERGAIPGIRKAIQFELFKIALSRSPRFFEEQSGGTIGQAIKQAGRTGVLITQSMTSDFPQIAIAFTASFVLLGITGQIWLAVILLVWSLVFSGVAIVFANKARPSVKKFSMISNKSGGEITDILSNYETVRSSWGFLGEFNRFSKVLKDEHDANIISRGYLIRMSMVHGIASWCLVLAIILYCTTYLNVQENIGSLATGISLSLVLTNMSKSFSRSVLNFSETWQTFSQSVRLLWQEGTPIGDYVIEEKANTQRKPFDILEFRDVGFRFKEEGPSVLRGVSFTVQRGEFIGIVGPSGAGKSTILKLIAGIYDPTIGTIFADEFDVSRMTKQDRIMHIGLVSQIPKLFARTVFDNVTYGTNIRDRETIKAALQATAADFVLERPEGLDQFAGVEGRHFSVGERQRITLARLLLSDKKLLLLDEPTSALDAKSEQMILECVEKLNGLGHTIICVSHRLSLVKNASKILVVDDGQITEAGSHQKLLKHDGMYRSFWEKQNHLSNSLLGESKI